MTSKPNLPQLLEDLSSSSVQRRELAHQQLLRRLDLAAVTAGICRLLSSPAPETRQAACAVAADLGPVAGPAMEQLLARLEDPEDKVRELACNALASLGEGACARDLVEGLTRAAHDPVYAVRKAAAMGLHRIGPRLNAEPRRGNGGQERTDEAEIPAWVQGLADALLAHVTSRGAGYVLTLPVGDNRMQRVRLTVSPARDTLNASTDCGPLHPSRYAWALEQNLHLTMGRLALRRGRKGLHDELVLLSTVPLVEAFPAQMSELVRRMALEGDRLEELLTGRDER